MCIQGESMDDVKVPESHLACIWKLFMSAADVLHGKQPGAAPMEDYMQASQHDEVEYPWRGVDIYLEPFKSAMRARHGRQPAETFNEGQDVQSVSQILLAIRERLA